ncbi:MAG: hypothetical protein MUD12_16060 [Spirochaetes bacterium]|nr:hypothetical protein [Spirochaetota bacterium]
MNREKKDSTDFFDLSNISKIKLDKKKAATFEDGLKTGIGNYGLFVKFPSYNWPSWVNLINGTEIKASGSGHPFILINNMIREGLSFTNFMSSEELFVDSSGMLSPSYDGWSLELWVIAGGKLHLPSEVNIRASITRDCDTSVISTVWEEKAFRIKKFIYGALSTVDEALVEINCNLRDKSADSVMVLAVRPYNFAALGGIKNIKFSRDNGMLSINGIKSVHVDMKPDYTVTGSGSTGDMVLPAMESSGVNEISCDFNLATMGLVFPMKKGDNKLYLRIALDGGKDLPQVKPEYDKIKKEYEAYAVMRTAKSTSIRIPDKNMQNWFNSSKISLLNLMDGELDLEEKSGGMDYRGAYYIGQAFNRMGLFTESSLILDRAFDKIKIDDKIPALADAVDLKEG